MPTRNAASVLPEPVGAWTSTWPPRRDRRPRELLRRGRPGERPLEPGPRPGREDRERVHAASVALRRLGYGVRLTAPVGRAPGDSIGSVATPGADPLHRRRRGRRAPRPRPARPPDRLRARPAGDRADGVPGAAQAPAAAGAPRAWPDRDDGSRPSSSRSSAQRPAVHRFPGQHGEARAGALRRDRGELRGRRVPRLDDGDRRGRARAADPRAAGLRGHEGDRARGDALEAFRGRCGGRPRAGLPRRSATSTRSRRSRRTRRRSAPTRAPVERKLRHPDRRVTEPRLKVTRAQILAFRRQVGALDRRLPPGRRSLRQAAWAGLQDSMPRAALLSIHARVEGTKPSTWEDPSLVQVWGPRYHVYVVAARDLPVSRWRGCPTAARPVARRRIWPSACGRSSAERA